MASIKKSKPRDTLIPAMTTPDPEPVPATPTAPVVRTTPDPEPAVAPQPSAPVILAPPSPKYRVTANCKASFCGQPVKLRKDDVIDSSGYGGAAGIQRLVESGAKLEEIK